MIDRFSSRQSVTALAWIVACFACGVSTTQVRGGDSRPAFSEIEKIVARRLAEKKDYQPGDLLCRSDVKQVFQDLGTAGWQPADRQKIEEDLLEDGSSLVRTLGSPDGMRLMRKVSGYKLIFDRMDRVSRVAGGTKMLQDLAKLPDGEKYAKKKTPNGVPDMLDLLPKNASGKKRSIKDYEKPTGRIYTEADLIQRLKQSYTDAGQAKDKQ